MLYNVKTEAACSVLSEICSISVQHTDILRDNINQQQSRDSIGRDKSRHRITYRVLVDVTASTKMHGICACVYTRSTCFAFRH